MPRTSQAESSTTMPSPSVASVNGFTGIGIITVFGQGRHPELLQGAESSLAIHDLAAIAHALCSAAFHAQKTGRRRDALNGGG